MSRTVSLLLGSLLIASLAAPAASSIGRNETPAAKLARAIEGRVPGEPVSCINLREIRSSRIIKDTAIVYEAGSTVYVNHPRAGRESLDPWDVLVTKTHSSRLCSIDVVQLYSPTARMPTGVVFLGDFVPYKKVRRDN